MQASLAERERKPENATGLRPEQVFMWQQHLDHDPRVFQAERTSRGHVRDRVMVAHVKNASPRPIKGVMFD